MVADPEARFSRDEAYFMFSIFQGGLLLAILAHHVCSITAMFSASLLMHMCFAAMVTQVHRCQGHLNFKPVYRKETNS